MNEQQTTLTEVARAIGTSRVTMRAWATRVNPSLVILIAAFNHLGYDLRPVEIEPDAPEGPTPPVTVLGREIDVTALPAALRQVLRFFADTPREASLATIAESIGMSQGTIEVYIVRLRKILAPHGLTFAHPRLGGYSIVEMK